MFRKQLNYLIIFLLLTATAVQASDAYTAVASFFAEYDKMLEQVAYRAQKVTNLSATEEMFTQQIQDYYCATYFLRTNSKGKIIAKVTEAGVQPRDFRYIGEQKWFEIISMTNKPYYGYTKNKSGYNLFWNKPIHVRRKNGLQFGGSISAKINMNKSFLTIATEEDVQFKVKLKKKTLFSNLPKGETNLVTKPLSVGGLPVLTITYVPNTPARSSSIAKTEAAVTSSQTETAVMSSPAKNDEPSVSKDETEPKTNAAKTETVETAKETGGKDSVTKTTGEEKKISLAPVIFFSALALAILICIIVLIAQVRHKRLLEAIDNDDF